jgi:Fic family protein
MKAPSPPPNFVKTLQEVLNKRPDALTYLLSQKLISKCTRDPYPHWDKVRLLTPPAEASLQEIWLGLKLERRGQFKQIPLLDKARQAFNYTLAAPLPEYLHKIDLSIGGGIQMPVQITNPQTQEQYYVESLIQEAITSSQLEGATTTRLVAKEMIRAGRQPQDRSEQMIFNNYQTMQAISELKNQDLSKELVFELHRLITQNTLDNPDAAGRLRTKNEPVAVVNRQSGEVHHDPPAAHELEERLTRMCNFANKTTPDEFIHPVIRAMTLHFWLAYDHPFVDGNGRTARALFYWAMLRYGYWMCEYISISNIILKGPSKYAMSFLHTESDDNDLTYFLLYHAKIITRAIEELHSYIRKQINDIQEVEARIKNISIFNHRQIELISHALRHPLTKYTIVAHQNSHKIAYQTARTDLLELTYRELFEAKKHKRLWYFTAKKNLEEALKHL